MRTFRGCTTAKELLKNNFRVCRLSLPEDSVTFAERRKTLSLSRPKASPQKVRLTDVSKPNEIQRLVQKPIHAAEPEGRKAERGILPQAGHPAAGRRIKLWARRFAG